MSKAGERSREGEVAKTTIGLYKTECVRDGSPFRAGPLPTPTDLEDATGGGHLRGLGGLTREGCRSSVRGIGT